MVNSILFKLTSLEFESVIVTVEYIWKPFHKLMTLLVLFRLNLQVKLNK